MGRGVSGPLRRDEGVERFEAEGLENEVEFVHADYSGVQRAEFGQRLGAFAIDCGFVVSAACAVGVLSLGISGHGASFQEGLGALFARLKAVVWLAALLGLAYFVLALWIFGRTLGKYILGLRLIKLAPRSLRFEEALLRELGLLFSLLPLGLGLLWPMFDAERRALHDYLAGTLVIRTSRG
jgi:uncharacterized RDD family membrane protein YckC